MDDLIVKTTKGLLFGSIASFSGVILINSIRKKPFNTYYDFLKTDAYIPVALCGLVGFSFGYTGKPLVYHLINYNKL